MRKNKGFTLAEVLLTLGIIGVVASLTLPSLNKNVQGTKAAPALMKSINTLQNALSLGMAQKGLRNLNSYTYVKDIFEENGPLYTTMDFYDPIEVVGKYYNYDGSAGPAPLNEELLVYTTKDGIDYLLMTKGDMKTNFVKAETYGKQGFYIFVDIDGYKKGLNRCGIDTFQLFVDTTGIVIPFGGYEYAKYMGQEDPRWITQCNSEGVTGSGTACAGSIIDNGGKVIYKFK